MNMKWKPITDGDLSGIPRDEEFLFTLCDELAGENFVTMAWIEDIDGKLEVREATASGLLIFEAKEVTAWMDIPEPYEQKEEYVLTDERRKEVLGAMYEARKMINEVENLLTF